MATTAKTAISRRAAIGTTALLTAVTLTMTSCADSSPGEGPDGNGGIESVSLKVGTMYGPENWQTQAMEALTDEITARSDGSITFEYFYGDALLGSAELAGGLRDGVIDLATYVPVYTPAVFPIDDWAGALASGFDSSPVPGTLQGIAAVAEWGFETEEYMAELNAAGITPLVPRVLLHAEFGILCSDEVTSLNDIRGKRARVGSTTAGAEAEGLGAIPTTVTGAEVYSAFQQGVIDCTWTNVPDMQALGLTDIAKNYVFAGLNGWSHAVLGFSSSRWGSLSEAAKDAIWESVPAYFAKLAEGNMAMNIQGVSIGDMNYTTPDADFSSTVASIHSDLFAALVADAPSSLQDAAGAIERAETLREEWLLRITTELGYSSSDGSWTDYVDNNGTTLPDLDAWVEAIATELLADHRPE